MGACSRRWNARLAVTLHFPCGVGAVGGRGVCVGGGGGGSRGQEYEEFQGLPPGCGVTIENYAYTAQLENNAAW